MLENKRKAVDAGFVERISCLEQPIGQNIEK